MTGRILKGVGGFYTVWTDGGVVVCKARGLFRKQGLTPLPGDRAEFRPLPDGTGYLEAILPRVNSFVRPPVCNIDMMVILASEAIPRTDPFVIDRMSAAVLHKGVEVLLCINKCDLHPAEELYDIYRGAGFPVLRVSALTGEGVEQVRAVINGKVISFTGNSGVGKSALLDRLDDRRVHKTGEVSERLGRGRHTTRHVELFPLAGGVLAADTPGFSAFDATEFIPPGAIAACFRDFAPYAGGCRFSGCLHEGVQGCAVEKAVRDGMIHPVRFKNYQRLVCLAREKSPWEKR